MFLHSSRYQSGAYTVIRASAMADEVHIDNPGQEEEEQGPGSLAQQKLGPKGPFSASKVMRM